MNWLQKIADMTEYLSGLGATPEMIGWIEGQERPNFYVDQFRQNPGLSFQELSVLQPTQRRKSQGPTDRERSRTSSYEPFFQRWALM